MTRSERKLGFESGSENSQALAMHTFLSPSPQPSPSGRGGNAPRAFANSRPAAQIGFRLSLSLRERVGVRGKGLDTLHATAFLGFGHSDFFRHLSFVIRDSDCL